MYWNVPTMYQNRCKCIEKYQMYTSVHVFFLSFSILFVSKTQNLKLIYLWIFTYIPFTPMNLDKVKSHVKIPRDPTVKTIWIVLFLTFFKILRLFFGSGSSREFLCEDLVRILLWAWQHTKKEIQRLTAPCF